MKRSLALALLFLTAGCSAAGQSHAGPGAANAVLSGVGPPVVQPGPNGRWLVFPEPNGQTDLYPFQMALGADGHVWFTVQEYSGGGEIGYVDDAGNITQYQIPVNAYPWDIAAAPDGKVWFADTRNSVIGSVTPGGTFKTYSVASNGGIAYGPRNAIWFGSGDDIGEVTSSGTIRQFTVGAHPYALTAGPDGDVWFTVGTITSDPRASVATQGATIGKMTPGGTVTFYTIPNTSGEGIGITTGHDGNLWVIVENGGSNGTIARVTPQGAVKEFTLPGDVQGVDNNRIISAPSGELWYTRNSASQQQYIGKISLNGAIHEYLYPTTNQHLSFLGGLVIGKDGNVWFSQTNPVQDGVNVYMRLFIDVKPSSIAFPAVGRTKDLYVFESDYAMGWSAKSSDKSVATVRAGTRSNLFVVDAKGGGTATITVSDDRGNYFEVPVSVPSR